MGNPTHPLGTPPLRRHSLAKAGGRLQASGGSSVAPRMASRRNRRLSDFSGWRASGLVSILCLLAHGFFIYAQASGRGDLYHECGPVPPMGPGLAPLLAEKQLGASEKKLTQAFQLVQNGAGPL